MDKNSELIFDEEWIKFRPTDLSDGKHLIAEYSIATILQNSDGTSIVLESDSNQVEVFFDGYVVLLRNCNEGLRLRTIEGIQSKYGQFYLVDSLIYRVKNSSLCNWAETECFGRYQAEELSHFCIVTANDLVDILSTFEPHIKISGQ